MINLDVLLAPDQARNRRLDTSIAVVLDVLRATTTIAAALEANAAGILPVSKINEARIIVRHMRASGERVLLCGEVKGLPPEGFDLGNSPREFRGEVVRGKRIVLKTTNGTVALVNTQKASLTVAASLANTSAVVAFLGKRLASNSYSELLCVCAGTKGEFGLEDFFAAGAILEGLVESLTIPVKLSDSAVLALHYFKANKRDPLGVISEAEHGRKLVEIGLGDDLPLCASFDRYPVVPVRGNDNWITAPW